MEQTRFVSRSLFISATALSTTLIGVNSPAVGVVTTVALFLTICVFGYVLMSSTTSSNGIQSTRFSPLVAPLLFLVGATVAILTWELSVALGLPGYIFPVITTAGCILLTSSARRRNSALSLPVDSVEEVHSPTSTMTICVLSLLLFVAAIPDVRSLLIPLALLNVAALYAPRAPRLAQLCGLIVTILIVRHATTDGSVLVFTDDSVWAEGFSAIVQQTGFWSWVGVSDFYSPLHWLAYGVAGWFTKATEGEILFGVTKAFPSVMCIVGASVVSLLRINGRIRSSFLVQVIAVISGLQIIGSQSISADMGFLAVLALAAVLRNKSIPKLASHTLLVCIAVAKIQFVPVAAIVVLVSHMVNFGWRDFRAYAKQSIVHLTTLALTTLLVLDRIPLSRLFGWKTNTGWGSSKVQFRGSDLLSTGDLSEILRTTFFIFVPAIVLILVFLIVAEKRADTRLAVPVLVTAATFSANIIFDIENREYFGWIAGAICAMYLFTALLGSSKDGVTKRLISFGAASAGTLSLFVLYVRRPDLDKWQGLQRVQVAIAVILAASVIVSLFPRLRNLTAWKAVRGSIAFSGVVLLLLPSAIHSADAFRESGLVIESKSGYSLSDLGYTSNLLQAGRWIRQFSDPSDVIGTNVLCEIGTACSLDGRPLVAAATHRRTFIEAERFAYGFSPIQSGGQFPSWILDRLTASMNCSSTGDQSACDALRSAGVDLLLVDTTRFSGSNGLPVCASFGSIQVVSIAIDKGENPIACPTHG